jgi:hypothetical protein
MESRPAGCQKNSRLARIVNFTSYNRRLLITGEVFTEEAKSIIGEESRQG